MFSAKINEKSTLSLESTSQQMESVTNKTDQAMENENGEVDTTQPVKLPADQLEEIFQNHNIMGVKNGPSASTTFTLTVPRHIYSIEDYHWNNGYGKKLGTIGLEAADGTMYGPWQTVGREGQGGVPNAYWTAYPDLELPAGTYTIIDSDNLTWSQNAQSGGQGMVHVFAIKQ